MKKIFTTLLGLAFVLNVSSQNFWEPTNGPFYQSTTNKVSIWALTVSNDILYAGVDNQYLGGVRKSVDFGDTWTDIGYNLPSTGNVFSIVVKNGNIFALTDGGIYKKCDTCTTWTLIKNVSALKQMILTAGGTILAIDDISSAGKLYRSTDDGATWDEPNSGMPTGFSNNTIFASSDGTIYWGTNQGIYKSVDNGSTWTASATTTIYTFSKCFAEAPNGDVYVALTNGIQGFIYVTSDDGANWNTVSLTGVTQVGFKALAIDSLGDVYIAAANTGSTTPVVFKYSGGTWNDITSGLPTGTYCNNFAFDSFGRSYVATIGEGVYRSVYTTVDVMNTISDLTFTIYPNPASHYLIVNTHKPCAIEILSLHGKLISSIHLNDGLTKIDISDLSKGLYLLKVQMENNIKVKKFIVE